LCVISILELPHAGNTFAIKLPRLCPLKTGCLFAFQDSEFEISINAFSTLERKNLFVSRLPNARSARATSLRHNFDALSANGVFSSAAYCRRMGHPAASRKVSRRVKP
jgi:hypothetical protein